MNSIFFERNRNKIFLLYLVITLVLLFQDILQQYITVLKWADEMIAISFLPITFLLFIAKRVQLYKEEKVILMAFAVFIVAGLVSSYLSKYQDINATVSDMIIVSKFIGAYFFARIIFCNIDIKDYFVHLKIIYRVITLAFFSITLLDIVFNIFPKADKRFIIYSEKLLFFHPTYMAIFCIVVMTYLTLTSEDKMMDNVFIAMIMLVCASTFRAKAMGLLAVYVVLLPYVKKVKRLKLPHLIIAGLVMLILFLPQFNKYYIEDEESPRNVLTTTSIKVAERFFPIGAGFGTFGSYISSVSYSPLYFEYQIDKVWGLEKDNTLFISDTFWPMIIGQFGFVGLFLFMVIVGNFFALIRKLYFVNINTLFFALVPFIYLMISSTSEASFANTYSVHLFIMIGMAVNQIKSIKMFSSLKYMKGNYYEGSKHLVVRGDWWDRKPYPGLGKGQIN